MSTNKQHTLTEEVAEALDGDGNVVKTRRQVDPREALRRILNDSGLDTVRTVLELCLTSREGVVSPALRIDFVYHLSRSISL